ncbi:MAG TPA: hypothetical protein VHW01_28685, partial [Polyangiaceae bacterium]|nr:hypothetical protein [Polyangiaceae bacterium]
MKSAYQYYRSAAVVACCLLGACHIASTDSAVDEGGGGASAAAGSEDRGGNTAAGGMLPSVTARAGAADTGAAGQAGSGEAGDSTSGATSGDGGAGPQSAALDPATEECDVDGGCASKCTTDTANCAVQFTADDCEFGVYRDVPASVACGQSVTVGIANCGECGSVAVEVYYDGTRCWQGIPDCTLPQFSGKFLNPHAP